MRSGAPSTTSVGFVAGLRAHGAAPALIADGTAVSYRDLADRVDESVARLGPNRQLVMVTGGNDLATISNYIAALAAGHPVILAADDAHSDLLRQRYRPDVLARGTPDEWEEEPRSPGPERELHPDLALVLTTSGTTGSPKAVRLSTDNVSSNASAIADYLELDATDVAITSLPVQYCYGLSVINSHLSAGGSVVLSENSVLDDCFWDAVDRHGVTSLAGVPHTFDLLDRIGFTDMSVPSLRRVTQAGGRLAPAAVQRYARAGRDAGWRFFVMYGQTEATARMAYLPPELAFDHPDSIGVAIPGGSIRLEPVDGQPDDVGELVYSGPNVMMGYAESADVLALGSVVGELRTGDLARCDSDGLHRIVGRTSRVAKLFGLRVDLDHVQELLAERGIDGVCVERGGTLLVAVTDADTASAQRWVAERLSVPLSSIHVTQLERLPRHPNGKPDLAAVAALLSASEQQESAPSDWASSNLRDLLATSVGVSHVADQDTFVSLGGDSLSYVEVATGLESQLGQLPRHWHTMSVRELERLGTRPSRLARIDTTVALRAVAILTIVGSHAALFRVRGGAHVLLAVAGFNFARFQLGVPQPAELARRSMRSVARIAVPSMLWLAMLALLSADHWWPSATLTNSYLGPREWSPAWRYWFIEALVMTLLVCTALLRIPRLRRLESTHQVGFATALLGVALVFRFDLIQIAGTSEPLLAPHRVLWIFVLGWLVHRVETTAARIAVSAVAIAAVPGFFGEPTRDAVVLVGLLVLIWVPDVRVPRSVVRPAGLLAAASLYIYLSHFQVFMPLQELGAAPWFSVCTSLAVGVALWQVVRSVPLFVARSTRRGRPG